MKEKVFRTIMLACIIAYVCTAIIMCIQGKQEWIIVALCAVLLSLVLIKVEASDNDIITKCARAGDLTGILEYAYYVACEEIEIKAALEKGKISKKHAWILLQYYSYRIWKAVRVAKREFNLDHEELMKSIDDFAEDKLRQEEEYARRAEEQQKDANM